MLPKKYLYDLMKLNCSLALSLSSRACRWISMLNGRTLTNKISRQARNDKSGQGLFNNQKYEIRYYNNFPENHGFLF